MANVNYIAKLYLVKTVDTFDENREPEGNCGFVFDAARVVTAEHLTGPKGLEQPIKEFLEQYGLTWSLFSASTDEGEDGGRQFDWGQVEDADGYAAPEGAFLSDYALFVEVFEAKRVETPDFGL